MPKLLSDAEVEMMRRDGYVAPVRVFDAEGQPESSAPAPRKAPPKGKGMQV